MAKRVKTTTVKEELPEEMQPVDMSGDLSNLDILMQQFDESLLMVEVYKDELGHMEYCETLRGTRQIDKDAIRDTWGGGKFELRIYENNVLERTLSFRVANRKIPLTTNNNNGNVEATMLREQNAFFQRMVLTLLAHKQDGPGLKDVFDMVIKLNNPTSPEKTLDVLMKGMELGKGNGNASADWKSELIHTVKDLGKSVLPTVVEIAASRQPNNNGASASPLPVSPDAILKHGILELKQKVIKGLPVGLVLDWIVANAEQYQNLLKLIMRADYTEFTAIDPELNNEPFKTWFSSLHEGIRNAYSGNSRNEDSVGTDGNMGNVEGDGFVS